MTRLLAALAVVATPIAGLALLAPRSFSLVHCFQFSNSSGCSYRSASLADMLATAPEQLAPLLFALAGLCVLAVTAWWCVSGRRQMSIAAGAIGM